MTFHRLMTETTALDENRIPQHVAIIMDGNGRWAEKRGLMRLMGHKTGVESVKDIVTSAREIGVEILTLYAFSTENWQRPATEVKGLMNLLKTYLQKELAELNRNNVCLRTIGATEQLPPDVQDILRSSIQKTANNTGLTLNLALSYGAREEITRAVRMLATRCKNGEINPEAISEELISSSLSTAGQPDPDLLIRTGGEYRLSNFLLWQISYTEFYVTETPWPDFRKLQFVEAIRSYQQRQRRFGKTGRQISEH